MSTTIERETVYPESTVMQGPLLESGYLSAGLDYYKPTMSQLAYEQEPDAEVTFTFKNRGTQRLLDYIDPTDLQQRFADIRTRGWQDKELEYLAGLQSTEGEAVFSADYLEHIRTAPLPPVAIKYDQKKDDIALETTGPWEMATFWETVVMSEINEAYFEGYLTAHGLNPHEVYDEGDRRLSEKIAILQANPDIKFADFGTRRHFSLRWQEHVIERIMDECPDNFIGTSNVALADKYGVKPIGTFAHEMPMTYAGLADARGGSAADIRSSHNKMLQDWQNRYGKDLSVALTDTFGSEFFFSDFTAEQAEAWRGVRHDSGDPVEFGERLLQFYDDLGVDPTSKTVVFSDGLDIGEIVRLQKHFEGRINVVFGWGTTLTNDLGVKPLNVVMKATHVRLPEEGREAYTVKLSDNPGKHTGPAWLVDKYAHEYFDVQAEQPAPNEPHIVIHDHDYSPNSRTYELPEAKLAETRAYWSHNRAPLDRPDLRKLTNKLGGLGLATIMVKPGMPAELYVGKWGDHTWGEIQPAIMEAISLQQGWDADDLKVEHLPAPVIQMRRRWQMNGYKD
jgi:nicotinate phosphoribosyltransferase